MRLHSLDYLRGFAAFSIMIYHYFSFTFGEFDAGEVLGRVGIYGVSIFYILSGLTLYWVYSKRFALKEFWVKRIFRIFPLLWLASILHLLFNKALPLKLILLSFSGLFGFVAPDQYIAVGAWSIGNELVFYAFFPLFLWAARNRLLLILASLLFALYLFFAIYLNPSLPLADQWLTYINPLNQVFLFMLGFLMGKYAKREISNTLAIGAILLGCTVFCFYPVKGDVVNLVTGTERLIFTSCSALVCYGFYKISAPVISSLMLLGEISYAVYLMHPIMWRASIIIQGRLHLNIDPLVFILINITLTLVISYTIYQRVEKPFIRMGARLVNGQKILST